jgi:hypothetical protein
MEIKNILNPAYIYKRREQIVPYFQTRAFRLTRSAQRFLAYHGLPITENDRKLVALKDKHNGKRCFVIGNGPSLQISDLDRLKEEITFASNKIYLAFDQTEWQPTYYTVVDALVAKYNCDVIKQLECFKIFSDMVKHYLSDSQDILWLRHIPHPIRNGKRDLQFSSNVLEGVYGGWSVIYTQLELALYMGIKEVYLIGIDFSFDIPESIEETSEYGEQILEHSGEVNHFHPDYRKPGEKWTFPKLDLQYNAFLRAKKAFEAQGGVIYNASRKTALDVFPLADFDEVIVS